MNRAKAFSFCAGFGAAATLVSARRGDAWGVLANAIICGWNLWLANRRAAGEAGA